jgi:hypothetical protein
MGPYVLWSDTAWTAKRDPSSFQRFNTGARQDCHSGREKTPELGRAAATSRIEFSVEISPD